MICYLGDTRSAALLAEMRQRRAGVMVIRGRLRSRLTAVRWAYDNGAFADFKAGRAFDTETWQRDVEQIAQLPTREAPDFCVLPDIVGGGERSLELSLTWAPRVRSAHWQWYLAVQDGLQARHLDGLPDWIAGVFVGGTTEWKWKTAAYWRVEAARRGLLCHVGRVSSMTRVRAMKAIDVGSIDSAVPLFSKDNWGRFWAEVDSKQAPLFGLQGELACANRGAS